MAERGGVVPFEDVGVEVLDLAAAHGGDEVAEVPLARPALDLDLDQASRAASALVVPLGIELARRRSFRPRGGRCCRPSRRGSRPVFEPADLEDELRVAVVHDADLGVGRLALVLVAEPAAEADDGLGIRRAGLAVERRGSASGRCPSGGRPGCRCRRCRSPRTSASCSGPGWRGSGCLGAGPEPEVEIDFGGRSRDRFDADDSARLVAQGPRDQQLAELARLDRPRRPGPIRGWSGSGCRAARSGCSFGRPRRRSGLRGRCGCTASRRRRPCPPGRPRSSSARASGWAWRSRSRRRSCPRARGGCPATVAGRTGRRLRLDLIEPFVVRPRVGIDQVGDLDARHLRELADVGAAAAVEPGDGDADRVVGPDDPARRLGPADGKARAHPGGSQRSVHELTTTQSCDLDIASAPLGIRTRSDPHQSRSLINEG